MAASEIGPTRTAAARRHERQAHSGAWVLPLAAKEHQTAHVHEAPLRPVMAHLVVPVAWIGRPDLPTLLTRARQRQLVSAGRFDVAYQWFTWPWQVLGSFVNGFAHGASGLPLIGFSWRMRMVVAGIAVWQTVVAGQHAATVGIVVVIGLTYLLPWTRARHQRLVSQALADLERPSATPAAPATRRPVVLPVRPPATHVGRRPCTSERRRGLEPCGQWRSPARLVTCTGEGIRGRAHDPRTAGRKGSRS